MHHTDDVNKWPDYEIRNFSESGDIISLISTFIKVQSKSQFVTGFGAKLKALGHEVQRIK